MDAILTRIGKGSPLTDLELDQTLLAFRTAINAFSASYVPLPTVVPLINGGTNNALTPNGNRIMISTGTQIVEAAAITPNRAIISNSSGLPIASTATNTEISYLSGVTSAIQTQLNGKQATITVLPLSKGGTGSNFGAPTNGQLLIGNSGTSLFTLATLTQGSGISIDNSVPGAITISTTGAVSSVQGLAGDVIFDKTSNGTDFSISVTGQTVFFNLPTASTVNRGLVRYTGSVDYYIRGNGESAPLSSGNITDALGYIPLPSSRNLTINGVMYDLSADRTWTIPVTWAALGGKPTTLSGFGITDALPLAGGAMSGAIIYGSAPILSSELVNKAYVDTVAAGLNYVGAVRLATTTAGTLASDFENGDTIDSVVLATGDRLLIKNQADPKENGIYVVAVSGAPTRATDSDSPAELNKAACIVTAGTVNHGNVYAQVTPTPTIGSSNIVYNLISTGLTYTAGNGLTLAGSVFSITPGLTATRLPYWTGAQFANSQISYDGGNNITITNEVEISAPGGFGANLKMTESSSGNYWTINVTDTDGFLFVSALTETVGTQFLAGGKLGVNFQISDAQNSNFAVNGSTALGTYKDQAAPTNGLIVSGNVGVGIITPTAKFHVVGASNTSADYALKVDSSTTNIISVRDDNKVGILQATPTSTFDLNGVWKYNATDKSIIHSAAYASILTSTLQNTTAAQVSNYNIFNNSSNGFSVFAYGSTYLTIGVLDIASTNFMLLSLQTNIGFYTNKPVKFYANVDVTPVEVLEIGATYVDNKSAEVNSSVNIQNSNAYQTTDNVAVVSMASTATYNYILLPVTPKLGQLVKVIFSELSAGTFVVKSGSANILSGVGATNTVTFPALTAWGNHQSAEFWYSGAFWEILYS